MEFYSVEKLVSSLNKYYDLKHVDSVSIILFLISIITLLYILYILFGRKKCSADKDLTSTPGQNISRDRIKKYSEAVPRHSPVYANIIGDIHFAAARLHHTFYEEKCLALIQMYPEAVNSPKPPLLYTPFLRACWCGNSRVVQYMLKNGADITLRTKEGDTPMFLAVYSVTKKPHAYDPTCINLLYNAGCDINAPKTHGYTPLHMAAKAGNVDLVRWLLVHGADPDGVTKCNKKPVDFANGRGHRKTVLLLTVRTGDESCQQRASSGSHKQIKTLYVR